MTKKIFKAFSLVEVLFGLTILGLIVLFLLPVIAKGQSKQLAIADQVKMVHYSHSVVETMKKNIHQGKEIMADLPRDLSFYPTAQIMAENGYFRIHLSVKHIGGYHENDQMDFQFILPKKL